MRTLTDDERVVELARMLAGLDDTETGRAHAEELLADRATPSGPPDRSTAEPLRTRRRGVLIWSRFGAPPQVRPAAASSSKS